MTQATLLACRFSVVGQFSNRFRRSSRVKKVEFTDEVTDGWQQYEIDMLINHADLKFDGFEDLELLQNYIPHLDKKLYCIYLWENKAGPAIAIPKSFQMILARTLKPIMKTRLSG